MAYYDIPKLEKEKYYAYVYETNMLKIALIPESNYCSMMDRLAELSMDEGNEMEARIKYRKFARYMSNLSMIEFDKERKTWSIPDRLQEILDKAEGMLSVCFFENSIDEEHIILENSNVAICEGEQEDGECVITRYQD